MLGLDTTFQPPVHESETGDPCTPPPVPDTVSVPSGPGLNGAGRAGVPEEPVIWNSGAIGVAEQLFTRQPSPKVCCRLASRE